MKRACSVAVFMIVMIAGWCCCEVIELIDGTKMSGTVMHAYNEAIEIKLEGGEVMVMQLEKLKSVVFTKIEPRPEFSTPEKAFKHYLSLMRQGDIDRTVSCYRLMYQKMMREELSSMTASDKAKMQEEMVKTEFELNETIINGKKARIPVKRYFDGKKEEAEFIFVKENGEWKLAMSLMPEDSVMRKKKNIILTLVEGTRVKGEIVHIYDDNFEIRGENGELIEFDRMAIQSFELIPSGPRPQFSSPEKTFSYYLSLLKQGKIEETVECYRLMLQNVIAEQIVGMAFDDKAMMQKETIGTKFEYKEAKIDGERAILSVTKILGKDRNTADVSFVKENEEWKLSMPTGGGGRLME